MIYTERNRYLVFGGFLILLIPLFINMLQFDFRIAPVAVNIFFSIYVLSQPKVLFRRDVEFGSVIFLVIWCFLSLGLFLLPYNPSSVLAFPVGIHVFLIPVLTFFLALRLRWTDVSAILSSLILLHVGLVLVSILLHFSQPDFYTVYLATQFAELGGLDLWQYYARLQGPLGSTSIGVLCCSSIFLMPLTRFSNNAKTICILIFAAGSFLTFQRSSMFLVFFGLLFNLKYMSFFGKFTFLFFTLGILTAAFSSFGQLEIIERIFGRIGEIQNVLTLGDRSSYGIVLSNLTEYMLGFGLGATTSLADSRGYNPGGQIVDANHLRIMSDLGIAGLAIFTMSWLVPISKAVVFRRVLPLIVTIVAFQLQALGTNVFDSYYTGHLYWFYLGLLTLAVAVRESPEPNGDGSIGRLDRSSQSSSI